MKDPYSNTITVVAHVDSLGFPDWSQLDFSQLVQPNLPMELTSWTVSSTGEITWNFAYDANLEGSNLTLNVDPAVYNNQRYFAVPPSSFLLSNLTALNNLPINYYLDEVYKR